MKQVEEVEMKEKKQQKSKKKKGWDPLSLTVLLIALCVFVFSAYQLAMMMVPYYTGGEEILPSSATRLGREWKKLRSFRWISTN